MSLPCDSLSREGLPPDALAPAQHSPDRMTPAPVPPARAAAPHIHEMDDPADSTFLRQPHGGSARGYDLTLVMAPLHLVVPHEHYHAWRVHELTARLVEDGRLINPPIVARQGEKYVVLDGATRLTALHALNCPCIVVQVVDVAQEVDVTQAQTVHPIELSSWNHVLFGGAAGDLLATLRQVPGLQLTPMIAGDWTLPRRALGQLTTATGESFVLEMVRPDGAFMDAAWLATLNAVVECYGQWGNVERTLSRDVALLARQFADFAGLVTFPRFTPQMILDLAAQGRTVPAGITRFVIPGRILRLNVPLAKLMADEPLAAKQAWLDDLIRAKLQARQVRFYEEPVVLLDE